MSVCSFSLSRLRLLFFSGLYNFDFLGQLHLNEQIEEMAQELRVGNKFRFVLKNAFFVDFKCSNSDLGEKLAQVHLVIFILAVV